MSTDLTVRPDEAELDNQIAPVMRAANALVVENVEQHTAALELLFQVRQAKKAAKRILDPFVEGAHKTWKDATAYRAKFIDPLDEADALVSKKAGAFEAQERAKAETERVRLEAEALRRQEQARQMDAAMAETPEAAEEALTAPMPPPVVDVAPATAKVQGVTARMVWSAEMVNFEAFVAWCLKSGSLYLLEANMSYLNQRAKNEHEALDIPGVKAVSKVGYAIR